MSAIHHVITSVQAGARKAASAPRVVGAKFSTPRFKGTQQIGVSTHGAIPTLNVHATAQGHSNLKGRPGFWPAPT